MSIPQVRLGDVAELNPRLKERPRSDSLVSFLGMVDVDADRGTTAPGVSRAFGEVAKGYTQFANGDLLVAKITPCFENGKIAQAELLHARGAGSTEFHIIRPDRSKLDDRFLLWYLRQPWVRLAGERRMTGSAGQRRVPEIFLADLRVPLPVLEEQRKIAWLLDKVDTMRAKRRMAIALLNDLAQSVFLEMFQNSDSKWPRVNVADLAEAERGSIRTGPFGSQLLHEEFVDSGVAVLGIDNAVDNEFKWKGQRFIKEEKYAKLARYTVHPGDVIITIMGTCGRCAVVPGDIPRAINTKHLCCITLDQSRCLPEFLHSYFLIHPTARNHLERHAKGAIMAGLNMGIIKELPVDLPPLDMQTMFVNRVLAIRQVRAEQQRHLAALDTLFASVQHHAFRGQLWEDSEAALLTHRHLPGRIA